MLLTLFNDKNPDYVHSLQQAIDSTSEFAKFRYPPQVSNLQVGDEVVAEFEKIQMIPTLLFVDPFGYKGLSLRLINSVLRNWGSDCIVFFNYNRINAGLGNMMVRAHMEALFGQERAERLRARLQGLGSVERELAIVEEIAEALKEMGGKYVLPFRFRNESGTRTKHHLIFVSKHFRGYGIMKDIMAKESSTREQGVPSFEYNPATRAFPLLFELSKPLDELEGQLLNDFAGRTLTLKRIYEMHSVGRPFVLKNYREVLINLEAKGAIEADPPAPQRKRNTFAPHVAVTFPAK